MNWTFNSRSTCLLFYGMFNHISVYLWQQVCTQALQLRTKLRERNWASEMNTSSKARLRQKKMCESLGDYDDESAYYHVRVSGIKVSDQWQTSSAVQMPREITTQTWNMEAHDCTFGTHTEIERKSQLEPGFCPLRFCKPDELNDTQWSRHIHSVFCAALFCFLHLREWSIAPQKCNVKTCIKDFLPCRFPL